MNIERDIIINEYIFEIEYLLSNVLDENTLLNELNSIQQYVKNNYGKQNKCVFNPENGYYTYSLEYSISIDENIFVNMIDNININKYDIDLFFKYFYIKRDIKNYSSCNNIVNHYIKIMNDIFKKDYDSIIFKSKLSILCDLYCFKTMEHTIDTLKRYLKYTLDKIKNVHYNKDYTPLYF